MWGAFSVCVVRSQYEFLISRPVWCLSSSKRNRYIRPTTLLVWLVFVVPSSHHDYVRRAVLFPFIVEQVWVSGALVFQPCTSTQRFTRIYLAFEFVSQTAVWAVISPIMADLHPFCFAILLTVSLLVCLDAAWRKMYSIVIYTLQALIVTYFHVSSAYLAVTV